MKEVVDIYSKILIATFSFIAPSMTFFLGIFAKGTSGLKEENEERIKVFNDLITKSPDEEAPRTAASTKVFIAKQKKKIKLYEQATKRATKDINLVNPIRQVIRIFSALLSSAIFLSLYFLFRSAYLNMYELFRYKVLVLAFSITFFCYAMYAIGQVFFLMVRLKQKEYQDQEDEKNSKATVLEKDNGNS